MALFSWTGSRPANLGIRESRLAPCPASPNCVSSDEAAGAHHVAALALAQPPEQAWRAARAAVRRLARTTIISESDHYLHAECASAVFGFIDDLELHFRPAQNIIAVRSAARVGYSDFGVNRRRVEQLRASLAEIGAVR